MAQFAPVGPVELLRLLPLNTLGGYHLPIATDVLAHPEEYQELFGSIKSWTNNGGTTILDNGLIEAGTASSHKQLLEAAKLCDANVIVLPDVYEDGAATTDQSLRALGSMSVGYDYMFVPQGKTMQEFAACANSSMRKVLGARIKWWGCPRNLVANIGTRQNAIRFLKLLAPGRKIHMLGFSDDMVDDIICANMKEVDGIDSAVPLRSASHDIEWHPAVQLPPRGDWWNTAAAATFRLSSSYPIDLIKTNINRARKLMQAAWQ